MSAGPTTWGYLGFHPVAETIGALWETTRSAARATTSAYVLERLADLQVTLESAAAAVAGLPEARGRLSTEGGRLLDHLTHWRTERDLGAVAAELGTLLGRTVAAPPSAGTEEEHALAALAVLVGGTEPVLDDARSLAEDARSAYLAPAVEAVTASLAPLLDVVREDFDEPGDFIEAGLVWILDPLSAVHTCALMLPAAAAAEAAGDWRPATVVRRWAYARVRTDTAEGLSPSHLAKTRLLVAGSTIPVAERGLQA